MIFLDFIWMIDDVTYHWWCPIRDIPFRYIPLNMWGFPETGVPGKRPLFIDGICPNKLINYFGDPHLWTPPCRHDMKLPMFPSELSIFESPLLRHPHEEELIRQVREGPHWWDFWDIKRHLRKNTLSGYARCNDMYNQCSKPPAVDE